VSNATVTFKRQNVRADAVQKVTIMAEDDAFMTDKGYEFFRPRQTEFYLIK
jgi:hypothetical protein